MINWLKYRLPLLAACCMLWACSDDDDYVTEDTTESEKEATLLLYMVGQNSLSSYFNANIKALKTGYANTAINANVLVYIDISSTPKLYLLEKDQDGNVQQTVVKTYDDQYSVDPAVMKTVLDEVFSLYPAGRMGVIFSSHGNGSLYSSNTVGTRCFGSEGSSQYTMNITDIADAMDDCPYFDMIMFDACLMASVETAYELKEQGHYFLAAPNSIPNAGFPYDEVLEGLLQMDADRLTDAAKTYYEHYQNNTSTWDDFAAISITDMTQLDGLALYMDSMFQCSEVTERIKTLDRDDLQYFEENYPLYDFGEWVDSIGVSCDYRENVHAELDKAIIYQAHDEYLSVSTLTERLIIPLKAESAFSGLNTYVPNFLHPNSEAEMITYFTTMKWYKDAGYWRSESYSNYEN